MFSVLAISWLVSVRTAAVSHISTVSADTLFGVSIAKTLPFCRPSLPFSKSPLAAATSMSQLHSNLLKLLLSKKQLKLSAIKARRLREALKRLHEEAAGEGHESSSYFGVPLQLQQQGTSSLISSPVPHILEAITSHLLEHAGQEGILRKSGNERRATALKDMMEANNGQVPPGQEYSVHDVTCVLKRWLRALPEPVVPHILHEVFVKCVQLESHHHRTQSLLLACLLMPAFHLNTLKHVALFLQEVSKLDTKNKMSSANLAKVVAPSLMPGAIKVETNPEMAARFSERATIAVQVLIDHAQLIGTLPPELEPLKDTYKISSEDELSDHGEPMVKRKLFTFLKSKGGSHKAILRGSSTMRNSRKLAPAGGVIAFGGTNLTSSKPRGRRPSGAKLAGLNDTSVSDPAEQKILVPEITPTKGDIRTTRGASKRRQLSAETVGRIRERRALRAIQNNSKSQSSVRSLPTTVVTNTGSGINGRRRSVRRAATCRTATRIGSTINSSSIQRVPRTESKSSKAQSQENVENTTIEPRPVLTVTSVNEVPVLRKGGSLKAEKNLCNTLQENFRETIKECREVELRTKPPASPVDKESARKSFLAAMLGAQEGQNEIEKLSVASDKHENDCTNHEVADQLAEQKPDSSITNSTDFVDGANEPALDRHGALRKPLMPSNRRALRREPHVRPMTATITVQL
ncbi:rho GTPase-activating protein 22-like isoform X2 [Varroa jacobsoni]|uniref:rho GTPase-activating protein 22-like isoform X2 n=1 Tax=Varroa jacobsoni TaxID=62625 RepID=UPI000BFA6401|nr:rho GTPase-activating protein 22-like isoform X2 [Varroa jacobsoni]